MIWQILYTVASLAALLKLAQMGRKLLGENGKLKWRIHCLEQKNETLQMDYHYACSRVEALESGPWTDVHPSKIDETMVYTVNLEKWLAPINEREF